MNVLVINRQYYVAITGMCGSGKTTVIHILDREGFFTKDYDLFSTKIIKESKEVHLKLCEIIGTCWWRDNKIDLKRIGKYFDNHVEKEKRFEAWYQPYLGEQIKNDILENDYQGICFFDVPFIEKKKIYDLFDEIWIVDTDVKLCCERIQNRNKYSYEKAKYLVSRSSPLGTNFGNTYIINNNFSKQGLKKQVMERALDACCRSWIKPII